MTQNQKLKKSTCIDFGSPYVQHGEPKKSLLQRFLEFLSDGTKCELDTTSRYANLHLTLIEKSGLSYEVTW